MHPQAVYCLVLLVFQRDLIRIEESHGEYFMSCFSGSMRVEPSFLTCVAGWRSTPVQDLLTYSHC